MKLKCTMRTMIFKKVEICDATLYLLILTLFTLYVSEVISSILSDFFSSTIESSIIGELLFIRISVSTTSAFPPDGSSRISVAPKLKAGKIRTIKP